MKHVFISHSSDNVGLASDLCGFLETSGFPCWISSRDICAGEQWASAIVAAIKNAKALVLIISDSACKSPHVPRELQLADQLGITIIPVLLPGVQPSDQILYFTGTHQFLYWDGRLDDNGLVRVLESLRKLFIAEPPSPQVSGKVDLPPCAEASSPPDILPEKSPEPLTGTRGERARPAGRKKLSTPLRLVLIPLLIFGIAALLLMSKKWFAGSPEEQLDRNLRQYWDSYFAQDSERLYALLDPETRMDLDSLARALSAYGMLFIDVDTGEQLLDVYMEQSWPPCTSSLERRQRESQAEAARATQISWSAAGDSAYFTAIFEGFFPGWSSSCTAVREDGAWRFHLQPSDGGIIEGVQQWVSSFFLCPLDTITAVRFGTDLAIGQGNAVLMIRNRCFDAHDKEMVTVSYASCRPCSTGNAEWIPLMPLLSWRWYPNRILSLSMNEGLYDFEFACAGFMFDSIMNVQVIDTTRLFLESGIDGNAYFAEWVDSVSSGTYGR